MEGKARKGGKERKRRESGRRKTGKSDKGGEGKRERDKGQLENSRIHAIATIRRLQTDKNLFHGKIMAKLC